MGPLTGRPGLRGLGWTGRVRKQKSWGDPLLRE